MIEMPTGFSPPGAADGEDSVAVGEPIAPTTTTSTLVTTPPTPVTTAIARADHPPTSPALTRARQLPPASGRLL